MNNNYGVTAGNIGKNVQIHTAETVNISLTPENHYEPLTLNWYQICESRLDAYEERFFKNNPLTGINFYVPLGLVEPKREQEKRQKQEVNPEDGSQFYQLAETEITKTYNEPNQFFEEVLRQGNSKTKGQRLAIIGEPGAGKTTLLYQIARWILQENLGYPILIRLADVDKPIRDYLTQNWLRDATGSLREVSPEWVSGFEGLMRPPQPPLSKGGLDSDSFSVKNKSVTSNSNSSLFSLPNSEENPIPTLNKRGLSKENPIPTLNKGGLGGVTPVYLLLDAVDEMGITSPLVTINQQLAEGWTQGLRVVLTCRLNVWEGEKNALRDFDVYRNLDFNSQQIQDFIEQWFNDKTQSQELLKQLNESNQNRINDLIKNPLRLALLCRTWKRGQKLPETQAGLYQRLVKGHYQWKDEQKPFQIPLDVQECLHQQLGELAKNAINREQFRFRLEEKFVEQYLGKRQRENSLFDWALKLGWLNRVGLASVEEKDSDQAVYAFFHPTFQEYFAALAIKDWDYFLPRNHVNCPVEGKEYRIFQPQWKQVILLWLGRDDVEKEEKEAFIQKLVNFETGCYGNFYGYRTFFLAAAGINEFKECSLSDEIVETIVAFAFGYFDSENHKWITCLDPIEEGARTILPETIREKAIANLIPALKTIENEEDRRKVAETLGKIGVGNELAIRELIWFLEATESQDTCWRFAKTLEEIAVGNNLAIQMLIKILETSNNKTTRWWFAESLEKIAVGNELAIRELIRVLETTENQDTRWFATSVLGEIAVGNELAIRELIRVLETTENQDKCWTFAYLLDKIHPKSELAIQALIRVLKNTKNKEARSTVAYHLVKITFVNELATQALIQVLENTEDEDTRWKVAESLWEIDPGNELAIQALIQVLENTEDEDTRWKVAESLEKIDPGNELAIQALIQVLENTEDKDTRWKVAKSLEKKVAESLEKIDPGNELAIQALIRVLETTDNKYTRREVAESLGKIAVGNELAIQALLRVLENTENQDIRWTIANSLGKIAVGNELAIGALIRVLETTKDEDTRREVAESLGKIAVGNELAIPALIRVLETTENEFTRIAVAYSLGQIYPGNELAIRELIRVLETTENEDTRRRVTDGLGEIAVGNELAIRALIRVLETTENEDNRRKVAESLGKIIKTEKQYADVVFTFNHNLTDEVYKNNFDLFEECFKLLWQCAQNLPYPKFYQAWHHNTLTPHPEITNNTPVGNTPTVRQLEQQFTDICTQLPHLPLHCINVNKLLTLNTKNEFIQAFCNRLYQKLLPDETPPEVQTPANLETKIIHLKQQLQTHLFILLLADGTPTPEVIDCCDYLTEVLHLGWITPDPLPLPSPQRSFVTSQDNLLEAVESWVREY